MNAGLFSRVCTKFGWNASFSKAVIAPSALSCFALMGSLDLE